MLKHFFKKSKTTPCITFAFILSLFIISTNFDISQASFALNKTLNVVTSVSPITNIVKNIGGDKINLTGLVPEGVNSHTYEPVPSDIVKLINADLVIINGLYLEGPLERIVNTSLNTNPNIQLLKLGDNTITPAEWVFDFSFPREQGHPNPHLWLNPIYVMKFANLTKDKLIKMDPNNTEATLRLANIYIAVGEPDTAVKLLEEQLASRAGTSEERAIKIARAIALYNNGYQSDARMEFDSLLRSVPDDPSDNPA